MLFYKYHISCDLVYGRCQCLPHILNCLLCSHVQIIWHFDLAMYLIGYNTLVKNQSEVEYNVSDEDILSWCGTNSTVIRGSNPPCYRSQGFNPWIYIVIKVVIKIFGNKHVIYYLVQPIHWRTSLWVLYYHSYNIYVVVVVVVSGLQAVCHVRIMMWQSSNLEQWKIQRPSAFQTRSPESTWVYFLDPCRAWYDST